MDELEEVLRRFRPRRPRPLPELVPGRRGRLQAAHRSPRWSLWIAASGLAAAAITVAMVIRDGPTPAIDAPRVVITLGALNAQGLASAEDLDHMLTRTSRAILPDVEQPGGVLQALSKE